MSTKCKNCCLCPKEVIDNYKQLKKDTEKEFENLIKNWFVKHPYVDTVHLADTSPYFINSMIIYNNGCLKASVNIKES